MSNNLIPFIGITGGIGSGKSLICRIFSCLHIPIFDSDSVAKQLIEQDPVIKQSIINLLGSEAYEGQHYNRAFVKKCLSEQPSLVTSLNQLIHPAVRKAAVHWHQKQNSPFALYESALFTVENKPAFIDQVIAVQAPLNNRLERIEKRNPSTDMKHLIKLQPTDESYTKIADHLIENGKHDKIWPQISKIYQSITGKVLLMFCLTFALFPKAQAQKINAITFNIRMDTQSDGINQWANRSKHCAELIQYHQADFIGMQEAFIHQIKDLAQNLPAYAWFGKGRDDGKESGEFSPLFYNKKKFTLLRENTFWLSDSCDKVGFGWDAACRRVVTWGEFQAKSTGKKFFVFNTHFDHLGKIARRESSKLVLRKITEIAGKNPVIMTGDFNATPDDEPIQILIDPSNPERLIDAEKISKKGHYGPYSTFNAFKQEQVGKHIDYIFVKNGPRCLQHSTHSETWENRFPSDHFPVSAILEL
jgi:dephospho-CoA kinase